MEVDVGNIQFPILNPGNAHNISINEIHIYMQKIFENLYIIVFPFHINEWFFRG